MKFCKDCKWEVGERCLKKTDVDIVTGETTFQYCRVMRMHTNEGCGYKGKLWEPQTRQTFKEFVTEIWNLVFGRRKNES